MNIHEKINELEKKKEELEKQKKSIIEKRKNQIGNLAEKTKTLHLEDKIITGALILALKAIEEKDTQYLNRLKEIATPFLKKNKRKAIN